MNNLDKRILEITKVYDNNGETYDRYTVFTPDGAVYGMSEGGEGFNQYIGDYTEVEMGEHLGTKLDSVPESIKSAVLNRMVDSQFVDLFQYYELMPENVSATFNMYYEMNDNEWSYDSLSKLQSELKELGYTFDYGLDAEPYGLRPIELSLNQLKDFEEYAKGGNINSGRDAMFKSQEPHEQRYKRKREWKEYKKEGWFGDWFRDGGSMDDYTKSLGMLRVKFADPKYNYETNVSGSITEEQARNYFVGKMFDVGTYPNENMQKAIDIDFYEKGTYENGGGVGNFSEYSNDALTDAIINLSRFENTEDDIQTLKEELKKRKESIKLDSEEEMVKSNLYNGEISCEKLTEIIGCKPNYPYQIVGAIKLEKCYLRPYYKLV